MAKKKASTKKPKVKYITEEQLKELIESWNKIIGKERRRTNNLVRVMMALPKRFMRRTCKYEASDGYINKISIGDALLIIDP